MSYGQQIPAPNAGEPPVRSAPPGPRRKSINSLSDLEVGTIALTADLWVRLCAVVGNGLTRDQDLAELATHIHAIQHAVMAQAAARNYPDLYRLLGQTLANV